MVFLYAAEKNQNNNNHLLIRKGQFREDFYYRINVISLHIPPLRERLEDVPFLADHFLKHYIEETGKFLEGFTQRALHMLTTYHWPGNVGELRNVIERKEDQDLVFDVVSLQPAFHQTDGPYQRCRR